MWKVVGEEDDQQAQERKASINDWFDQRMDDCKEWSGCDRKGLVTLGHTHTQKWTLEMFTHSEEYGMGKT